MLDETVRQPELKDICLHSPALECFQHRAAGTAGDYVLFDRNQQLMFSRQRSDKIFVEGFHKAHVRNGRVQTISCLKSRCQRCPERKNGNPLPFASQLATPRLHTGQGLFACHSGSHTTRVAHRRRSGHLERRGQHLPALVLIRGRHDHNVWQAAQVGQIKTAMVGRAIRAN